MNESEVEYLDVFPEWLRTLADDAESSGELVANAALPGPAREALVAGVNYLFKSVDLIPDGIDDIGYLDDAFVLRVAAEHALREDMSALGNDARNRLARLAEDAACVRGFLGDDFARLDAYVDGLRKAQTRGRTVKDIVQKPDVQHAFLADLRRFASSYAAPSFAREPKNLIKLRAFFEAKLPKAT